jgi:two-component system sensor histidine kinase BaeS
LTLDVQRVSLAQVAQGSLEAFRARATAAGVTLEQEMPGDLPDVLVDPRRVSQIIDNLLENAITHTPAGGAVTVATNVMENWDGSFDGVYVAVSDTGAGIRAEDLEYVFDRFYRTDPSRSRTTGGSGLGLTIARQLAIAQGGQLTVESVVGEGSRFTLTLPVEG